MREIQQEGNCRYFCLAGTSLHFSKYWMCSRTLLCVAAVSRHQSFLLLVDLFFFLFFVNSLSPGLDLNNKWLWISQSMPFFVTVPFAMYVIDNKELLLDDEITRNLMQSCCDLSFLSAINSSEMLHC